MSRIALSPCGDPASDMFGRARTHRCRWLCARGPSIGGMHRKASPKGVVEAAADHRILAAVAFAAVLDDSDNPHRQAGASSSGNDCSRPQVGSDHNSRRSTAAISRGAAAAASACQRSPDDTPAPSAMGVGSSGRRQQQPGGGLTALVATGSSDGVVRLLHLRAAQHQWVLASEMRHHGGPVLSLVHLQRPNTAAASAHAAHVPLPSPTQPGARSADWNAAGGPPQQQQHQHFLVSGSTDGGIAVWDVTAASVGACSIRGPASQHLPRAAKPRLVAQVDVVQVSFFPLLLLPELSHPQLVVAGIHGVVMCSMAFC